jgi:hypothetical protein
MIIGCRNINQTGIWFAQAIVRDGKIVPNSAIECMLRKDEIQEMQNSTPKMWLETCGTHSNSNAIMATRKDPNDFILSLSSNGRWYPRMPDILALWLNTPQNYSKMLSVRSSLDPDSYFGNEIPQYYPITVKEVFGVDCSFNDNHTWATLVSNIKIHSAVVLCLKIPGHFICAIGYDDSANEIIYVDPYPPRQPIDWKKARMGPIEHNNNVQPFIIIYPEET